MKNEELRIVAPQKRDREEMYDLIAKVFSIGGYFGFRDYCRDGYIDDSRYDWSASRVGYLGGRMVTSWGIWEYTMRLGRARVRTAGVGVVATHADYRKRGLMERTARAGVEALRGVGYDMSLLFGISGFYHRFGYVRAWNECTYFVPAAELGNEKPAARVREFAPGHRGDLAALYNRQFAGLTGTAVRPTYLRCRYPNRWRGYQWLDASGKLAGYVVVGTEGRGFECVEACGDAAEALRVLGMLGRRRSCTEVRFDALPYDHPLARRLRRGNCRVETRHVKNGGAMVRTVNLARTLAKMSGELTGRLRASGLAQWRGLLNIEDPRERVTLAIGRSGVRVASDKASRHAIVGGEEIAQLLLGTDEPTEVIEAGGMRVRGDAAGLAEALFPAQRPMLSPWDRY